MSREPMTIAAAIRFNPVLSAIEARTEPTEVLCNGLPLDAKGIERKPCGNRITLPAGQAKLAGASLCCDDCCREYNRARRIEECSNEWKRWLRDNAGMYAHFSTDHPDFNAQAHGVLKAVDVSKNVILYGPSGTGKTFLMLQQLKRGLWLGKQPIRVLWSDQLKKITQTRYNSREMEQYEQAGILGIEELFGEDSAREAYTSFVRNLIDVRLRLRKPTIITTQLHSKDVEGETNKYGNETRADIERRDAILRRIKERFVAIPTDRNFDHVQTEAFF